MTTINKINNAILQSRICFFAATLLAVSTIAVLYQPNASATSVHEEAGFADADLYECIINNYNTAFSATKTTDDVLSDSELAAMKELRCSYGSSSTDQEQYRISSTEGIQKMTGLERLGLSGTLFSSINLSANTKLKSLSLSYNFVITNLDISHNTELEGFYLWWLTRLANYFDFSNFPKIKEINIQTTDITGVNTDNNPLLEELVLFNDDQITTIKTDNNPELNHLNAHYTGITSLDVSKNKKLKSLDLAGTKITSLDIKNNKLLDTLDIYDTKISEIDLSENPLLKYVRCGKTNIETIDISKNPKVSHLNVPTGATIIASVKGWYDENGSLVVELSNHGGFIKKIEASDEYRYEESTKRLYAFNPDNTEISLNIDASPAFGNVTSDDRAILVLNVQIINPEEEPDDENPDSGTTDEPGIEVPNTGAFTIGGDGAIVVVSLGIILAFSIGAYISCYTIERRCSKVKFK